MLSFRQPTNQQPCPGGVYIIVSLHPVDLLERILAAPTLGFIQPVRCFSVPRSRVFGDGDKDGGGGRGGGGSGSAGSGSNHGLGTIDEQGGMPTSTPPDIGQTSSNHADMTTHVSGSLPSGRTPNLVWCKSQNPQKVTSICNPGLN